MDVAWCMCFFVGRYWLLVVGRVFFVGDCCMLAVDCSLFAVDCCSLFGV